MSIIGLLTGSNPKRLTISRADASGATPKLEIDAAIQQNTSRTSELTSNPVESGAQITDHVNLGNVKFDAECLVSEAPLSLFQSIVGGIAGGALGTTVGGALGSALGAAAGTAAANQVAKFALSPDIPPSDALAAQVANRIPGDRDYPKKVYDYLMALQQDKALIKIESRQATLTDLVITQLSAPITINNGRSIQFTMSCEQIQIITSATSIVEENIVAEDAAASAATKSNLGGQTAGAATEAQSSNASLLKRLFDSVTGG